MVMSGEKDSSNELRKSRALPIRPPPRGADLPYDDGEPMETARHRDQMVFLIHSLKRGWKARRDFYVGGNEFMYYSELQSKKNDFRGPDVFVVVGVEPKERKSWVVWEEEGRTPDVIIEITSESTADEDRVTKKRLYANVLKVQAYYIYDPLTYEIEGFLLDQTGEYVQLMKNVHGRLPCPPLELELGLWDGEFMGYSHPWLRWFTRDGAFVATIEEQASQQAAKMEEHAAKLEERAAKMEEHAMKLEERGAKLEERGAKLEERGAKLEGHAARLEEQANELRERLARYEARFGKIDE
jgi:Uma2 family endonuclease